MLKVVWDPKTNTSRYSPIWAQTRIYYNFPDVRTDRPAGSPGTIVEPFPDDFQVKPLPRQAISSRSVTHCCVYAFLDTCATRWWPAIQARKLEADTCKKTSRSSTTASRTSVSDSVGSFQYLQFSNRAEAAPPLPNDRERDYPWSRIVRLPQERLLGSRLESVVCVSLDPQRSSRGHAYLIRHRPPCDSSLVLERSALRLRQSPGTRQVPSARRRPARALL